MTVIELLFFLFNLTCGIVVGHWMGAHFGFLFAIPGFFLGFGGGIGFFKTIIFFLDVWHKWRPLRPICRHGVCDSKAYRWIKESVQGDVFQCCCGTKYLKTGNQFMEILPDGSLRPYMKYTILRGWEPENSQNPSNASKKK